MVEQAPVVIYAWDPTRPTGEIAPLFVSPQIEMLLGYSAAEWTADPGLRMDRVHPDDRAALMAHAVEAHRTGGEFHMEYRALHRDGSVVWIHDEANPVRWGSDGHPTLVQGVMVDITRTKAAEEHQRETQRRFQALVERLPAVTYVEDVETGGYRYLSPQIEELSGHPVQRWMDDPNLWEKVLHPDDRERVLAANAADTGDSWSVDYRMVRPDGRTVWVHNESVLIRDDDGQPLEWVGVCTDLTEQKEASDQVRAAEERFRAIVEHIPAAVYLDRPDGSMQSVYVSPQVETVMGVTAEHYLAEPDLWLQLMDDETRRDCERRYLEAIEARMSWEDEYRIRKPDGKLAWIHDETTFITDADGEPLFLLGVLFDITERKRADEALRESERREHAAAERLRTLDDMKNTFLAAVSHELRSPLTSILGLSLTLERTTGLAEEERHDLVARLVRQRPEARSSAQGPPRSRPAQPRDRRAAASDMRRRFARPRDARLFGGAVGTARGRGDRRGPAGRRRSQGGADRREPAHERDPAHADPRARSGCASKARRKACSSSWRTTDRACPKTSARRSSSRSGKVRRLPRTRRVPGSGSPWSARFAELHGGRAWVEERPGGGASFRVFLPRIDSRRRRARDSHPSKAEALARLGPMAPDDTTDHNPQKRRLHLPIVGVTNGPGADAAAGRKPPWLKVRLVSGPNYADLKSIMRGRSLHTVCEEAMCPNIRECWEEREATFLILGTKCTRRCGFCDVMTAKPDPVDEDEPARIAEAVREMGLRYVVLTGVARDDLEDGGARIWASAIRAVREAVPGIGIEVLAVGLQGRRARHRDGPRGGARRLRAQPRDRPTAARPDPAGVRVRPVARGAAVREAHRAGSGDEVEPDPRAWASDPTRSPPRWPTSATPASTSSRWASTCSRPRTTCRSTAGCTPTSSRSWKRVGEEIGIAHVEAGPLVRSSYHAGKQLKRAVEAGVAAPAWPQSSRSCSDALLLACGARSRRKNRRAGSTPRRTPPAAATIDDTCLPKTARIAFGPYGCRYIWR